MHISYCKCMWLKCFSILVLCTEQLLLLGNRDHDLPCRYKLKRRNLFLIHKSWPWEVFTVGKTLIVCRIVLYIGLNRSAILALKYFQSSSSFMLSANRLFHLANSSFVFYFITRVECYTY